MIDQKAEITEDHLKELKRLLLERGLYMLPSDVNPNYKFLFDAINGQVFDRRKELIEGFSGCILEGSSRSGKTWAGIDLIIYICLFVETDCVINIVRETYNEFKTTLYDDFKRRLDEFDIPHPFDNAQEIKQFKIGRNKIKFLGADKVGKFHGAGSDYVFFNEIIHIDQRIFDQLTMRCRKFWWGDYNPSVTEHWLYDSVLNDESIGYLRSTWKDNPHLSGPERKKILSFEPWKPGSYKVIKDIIYFRGQPVTESNQPPPHPDNIRRGSADDFSWRVYGLGLRGSMKGLIFKYVEYIEEFPDIAFTYGLDFGFTADPSAFVKYAEDKHNIWVELLMYNPTETADVLAGVLNALGIDMESRIACDSSDKYTGENKGTVEMVRDIKRKGYENAFKISKKKSVMFWLLSMKNKKIHIVSKKGDISHFAKKEQQNYRLKEINGIAINQPIDDWNHFWDATRYAHMSHNMKNKRKIAKNNPRNMGVNY
jgi:PBSX family phage terminase large subunit